MGRTSGFHATARVYCWGFSKQTCENVLFLFFFFSSGQINLASRPASLKRALVFVGSATDHVRQHPSYVPAPVPDLFRLSERYVFTPAY